MVPPARPFISIFERVPDPRQAKGRRHPLAAVLTIVVLALINQQNTLRQIAAWAQGLGEQIRRCLPLHHNRIPSEATIRRVLRNLDVEALTQAVQDWVEEVLTAYFPTAHWQGLAIDGKTLRRSRDEDLPALQVLHAMVHELGAFIRSQAIPAGRNELGAISPFLGEVVLEGRVVTLDALLTHRDIAQAILERGGHYLMRVKANQPQLPEDLKWGVR